MKISIIIPVFNSESYLKKCIDSVINQSYKNWQLIAIDDGSVDNSYAILQEYQTKDKRIQISKQKNKGPGITRNNAMIVAEGEYIVFLDSDDYIENDYLSRLVNRIDKTNSDLIFIDVIQEKSNGKKLKSESLSKYENTDKEIIIRKQMTGEIPWGGVRKSIKKSLIDEHKIEYTSDIVGEEALFSFKALYFSKKHTFLNKEVYHYVNHSNSQSKKGSIDPWNQVHLKMRKFITEHNLLHKYEKALNSLEYKALIIAIFKISESYKLNEAIIVARNKLKKYDKNKLKQLDCACLNSKILLFKPFVKANMAVLLILIAKFIRILKV